MRDKVDFAELEHQGRREYQEDACGFSDPGGLDEIDVSGKRGLLLVLADGMGGQAAGDVASKLAVNAFRKRFVTGTPSTEHFEASLSSANEALADEINADPDKEGMGCTLIGTIIKDNSLKWISVGDSLLYVIRDGQAIRVNRDHSMAPQIDEMVRNGELTEAEGIEHPDRNALISAVMGKKIPLIDNSKQSLPLRRGDIVLVATDGVETLLPTEIASIVSRLSSSNAEQITQKLLHAVLEKDDPYQDNITIMIVKVAGNKGSSWVPGSGISKSINSWSKSWWAIFMSFLLVAIVTFLSVWFFSTATKEKIEDVRGTNDVNEYNVLPPSGQAVQDSIGEVENIPEDVTEAVPAQNDGENNNRSAIQSENGDVIISPPATSPSKSDIPKPSTPDQQPNKTSVKEKEGLSKNPVTGEALLDAGEPKRVDENLQPLESNE